MTRLRLRRARQVAVGSSGRADAQQAGSASASPADPASPSLDQPSGAPESTSAVSWWLLVPAFAAIVVAAAVPLLYDWDTLEVRGQFATVTIASTGVLLGIWAAVVAKQPAKSGVLLVFALAVLIIVGFVVYARGQSRPIDVTGKVTFGHGAHTFTAKDGDGFDISVPLPEKRDGDTLKLAFKGTDPDRATGTSCLPSSTLELTDPPLSFDLGKSGAKSIPIKGKHGTVRLHAELKSGPACRIRLEVSSAVIDS